MYIVKAWEREGLLETKSPAQPAHHPAESEVQTGGPDRGARGEASAIEGACETVSSPSISRSLRNLRREAGVTAAVAPRMAFAADAGNSIRRRVDQPISAPMSFSSARRGTSILRPSRIVGISPMRAASYVDCREIRKTAAASSIVRMSSGAAGAGATPITCFLGDLASAIKHDPVSLVRAQSVL
jgi:hypothetical protein